MVNIDLKEGKTVSFFSLFSFRLSLCACIGVVQFLKVFVEPRLIGWQAAVLLMAYATNPFILCTSRNKSPDLACMQRLLEQEQLSGEMDIAWKH